MCRRFVEKFVCVAVLSVLFCHLPLFAGEKISVAFMVHRPTCDGWSPVSEEDGMLLASEVILRQSLDQTDGLKLLSWPYTSGISDALTSGLYIQNEKNIYRKWHAFIKAGIYVECQFNIKKCVWTVDSKDKTYQETITYPFENPKQCIAKMVKLVFKASNTPIPQDLEKQLDDPETKNPALFVDWAHWLNYHPCWLHHAPWDAARTSALNIMRRDPQFKRGITWALQMMRKPNTIMTQKRIKPTGEEHYQHAFTVLDSPFAEQVIPYLAEWLNDPKRFKEAVSVWGNSSLAIDMDDDLMKGETKSTSLLEKPGKLDNFKMPTNNRFRRNLCKAIGLIGNDKTVPTLKIIAQEDKDPVVRKSAITALSKLKEETINSYLQSVFAKDKEADVKSAALNALVARKAITTDELKKVLNNPDDAVAVESLKGLMSSSLPKTEKASIIQDTLNGKRATLRLAALTAIAEHNLPISNLQNQIQQSLKSSAPAECKAALNVLIDHKIPSSKPAIVSFLDNADPELQALAINYLSKHEPDQIDLISEKVKDNHDKTVLKAFVECLSRGQNKHLNLLADLIKNVDEDIRSYACECVYRQMAASGDNTNDNILKIMLLDPSLRVNLVALRKLEKKSSVNFDNLVWLVHNHPNEYIRLQAFQLLQKKNYPETHKLALEQCQSPFWLIRLSAIDYLKQNGSKEDLDKLQASLKGTDDKWLKLAVEEAECKLKGTPFKSAIPLKRGKLKHTEGGELPNGFQLWLGIIPKDRKEARKLVDAGYRFGKKTDTIKIGIGGRIRDINNDKGGRNTFLLRGVLDSIEQFDKDLPYTYYIAVFDEPCSPRGGNQRDILKAFLLEIGRPDLLPMVKHATYKELPPEFPKELNELYEYHAAKCAAELSNWVTKMFKLTAGKKYPDLKIFPQTLSYMRNQMKDGFDIIDADGDYSWIYSGNNYMGDYNIGAMNRVLNPGKPTSMVTWMGWHRPNILYGDKIYSDTEFPEGPWRFRNYMGTRSALALYASGVEAGFFNHLGLGKISERKDKNTGKVTATGTFNLTPWSEDTLKAINLMLDDPKYWDAVEGKVSYELLKNKKGNKNLVNDKIGSEEDDMVDDLMDEIDDKKKESPLQKAVAQKRQELVDKLMSGISYMNLFNTDATRALSNLPRPDTGNRSTLIIVGRDTNVFQDAQTFTMPAIALINGYDLAPTYDCAATADFMKYDTILLKYSKDGVTSELVKKINHWLTHKKNGLLYLSGDVNSKKALFPQLTMEKITEPFLWEKDIQTTTLPLHEETVQIRKNRTETRKLPPLVKEFEFNNKTITDPETRLADTFSGKIKPIIKTRDGKTILGQWNHPDCPNTVLLDGASHAGPVYTKTLEEIVLDIDKKRQSTIKRNPHWGHVIYETDAFVVDVASHGYKSLHDARPRKHQGVDIITGVINPPVNHSECALVLKDYVGPYAGAKGNWAVMAREQLKSMDLINKDQIKIDAKGVCRVTHIGSEKIQLKSSKGFTKVDDQLQVWKLMREKKKSFAINKIDGGYELHYYSPEPVVVEVK